MIINNVTLNFLDKYYPFYEWLSSDKIKSYKKCFIYKVSFKMMKDLLNNVVVFENTIFNEPVIFTDEYLFIALNFVNDKNIYKSSLTLEDEEKVLKLVKYMKKTNFKYNVIAKENKNNILRCENHIKNIISSEISNSSVEKIKYLYYEWFDKEEDDVDIMKLNIRNKLKNNISNNEKKIYDLIIKSYKSV